MAEENNLMDRVSFLVDDYIQAWKSMYSTLEDLNSLERDELLEYVQNQTGRVLYTDDFEYLLYKGDLSVGDITGALDRGDYI